MLGTESSGAPKQAARQAASRGAPRWQEWLCWLLKELVYPVFMYYKSLSYAKFRQLVPVAFFLTIHHFSDSLARSRRFESNASLLGLLVPDSVYLRIHF